MRLLAWPRRPSRMKLCRDSTALTICGHDGVVVADDAGEDRVAGAQARDQVVADFVFDVAPLERAVRRWLREVHRGRPGGRAYRHLIRESKAAKMRRMPLVYAHRGGAALRPENTIEAFDHGLACGADGLEFDVHLSRDNVVVVHHDDTLDRTTSVTRRLSDATADELADVARADPLRGARRATRRIPIIVEIKVDGAGLVRRVDRRAAASRRGGSCGGGVVLFSPPGRGARLRTAAAHRRVERGDAVGALSLVGGLADGAACRTRSSRCRSARA